MAFDKQAYDHDYVRQNYDRIEFTVPKGKKAELKALAKQEGLTVPQLLAEAVKSRYGLNLSK